MPEWIKKAMALFGLEVPKQTPKPKPWEDPNRPAWDRESWRKAEPKSLRKVG